MSISLDGKELIIGLHSIEHALLNESRVHEGLYCTKEGVEQLWNTLTAKKLKRPLAELKKSIKITELGAPL